MKMTLVKHVWSLKVRMVYSFDQIANFSLDLRMSRPVFGSSGPGVGEGTET